MKNPENYADLGLGSNPSIFEHVQCHEHAGDLKCGADTQPQKTMSPLVGDILILKDHPTKTGREFPCLLMHTRAS